MPNGFSEEWFAAQQAKAALRRARSPDRPTVIHLAGGGSNTAGQAQEERRKPGRGAPGEKPRHKINRAEEALQIQIVEFLDWALPEPLRFWHTPNQRGTRKAWEVALLAALGVKPGIGDILIGGWRTLIWIEVKTPTGTLSKSQKDWRDWCHQVGIPWFLCRSLEDVADALESLQIRLKARL